MGDVRFGMLPSMVPVLAGRLFTEVRKQWPQVRLHLTEGSSVQLEDWLVQGRLDLAILLREGAEQPGEVVLERIALYLVVPASHAFAKRKSIPFDEVATLSLVLPSEPHPLRARLSALARERGLSLVAALEANSIRLQHEMVACRGGFAITASSLAPHDTRRLATIPIVKPALDRTIVLATTTHRPHTLATRSVAELIRTLATPLLKS
nr:LysR substrate-binding domain-containing protein [Ramlibacter agri]